MPTDNDRVQEEPVLILKDAHGDAVAMVRRDATNHGRVQVFTLETAGWDDVKDILKGLANTPKPQ